MDKWIGCSHYVNCMMVEIGSCINFPCHKTDCHFPCNECIVIKRIAENFDMELIE